MTKAGGYESDCPRECRKDKKRYDAKRSKYCDDCPTKQQKAFFKDDVEDGWRVWFGDDHGFDFNTMLNDLYRVISCENLEPEAMSVKTGQLVAIFRSERSKHDRASVSVSVSTKQVLG